MTTVDFKRFFKKLGPANDPEYVLQDGTIFCWSESNFQYEPAWWLTDDGDPVNDDDHVKNLLRDRPFDKGWLK